MLMNLPVALGHISVEVGNRHKMLCDFLLVALQLLFAVLKSLL